MSGRTLLHIVSCEGNLEIVLRLLDRFVDVNA